MAYPNLSNSSINEAGPFAMAGGVVYGKDGQVIRRMVATVALRSGDAVILDTATPPFNVTKAATADLVTRYGIVVGGPVGTQVAAIGDDVWVTIEGMAIAAGATGISVGDLVGTSAVAAGLVGKSGGAGTFGVAGLRSLRSFPATVSLAASIASYSYVDIAYAPAGLTSDDNPIAFTPDASLPANMLVGGHWKSGSVSAVIRLGNPASVPIGSFASIPGQLYTARSGAVGAAAYGAVLGLALSSATAASAGLQVFLDKR